VNDRTDRAEEIVSALADCDPVQLLGGGDYREEFVCALCGDGFPHDSDCPWLRAKTWVGEGE